MMMMLIRMMMKIMAELSNGFYNIILNLYFVSSGGETV